MEEKYFVDEKGLASLKTFSEDSKDIDLGSLERESFTYLGKWKLYMNKDGYGIAYRMGIKNNFIDSDGDPAVAFFHFNLPLAKKNHFIKEQLKSYQTTLDSLVGESAIIFGKFFDNVVSINPPKVPDYMIKELEEIISN